MLSPDRQKGSVDMTKEIAERRLKRSNCALRWAVMD
jgi:hypothetical protein